MATYYTGLVTLFYCKVSSTQFPSSVLQPPSTSNCDFPLQVNFSFCIIVSIWLCVTFNIREQEKKTEGKSLLNSRWVLGRAWSRLKSHGKEKKVVFRIKILLSVSLVPFITSECKIVFYKKLAEYLGYGGWSNKLCSQEVKLGHVNPLNLGILKFWRKKIRRKEGGFRITLTKTDWNGSAVRNFLAFLVKPNVRIFMYFNLTLLDSNSEPRKTLHTWRNEQCRGNHILWHNVKRHTKTIKLKKG